MNKSRWSYVFSCLIILFVLTVVLFLGGYVYMTVNAATQSVVFIREPLNGERLEAGQPILVRALARDDQKITHIELWVDGQLVEAQTSNTQSGINPFPLLTTWYPGEGTHTLIVRSFNSRKAPSQATITVEAVTLVDWDVDGVADEADACPYLPGFSAADGCPDRDFDGIPDESDACPDEAGMPEDGCPAPGEGDRDGDGMIDEADACPDVPGSPRAEGCLDGDVDGVADDRDACPAEPGGGEDGCPVVGGGEVEPEPGGGEPLEPFPGSDAPIPGDDDLPEGGSDPPGRGFPIGLPIDLEIEAYEMYVGYEFDRIRCYARLDDRGPQPYEFEALGDRYWDIAAELGGENSERINHEDDEIPLNISVNCLGYNPGEEPVDLGSDVGVYSREDWYGQEQNLLTEVAGPAQYGFVIRFRICTPSCDASAVQPPILEHAPLSTGPRYQPPLDLRWRWDDNGLEGWTHFRFARYVNGTFTNYIDNYDLDIRSLNLSDYRPACGETVEFKIRYMGSEGGVERNTPWSNTLSMPAEPCPYTATVMFVSLDVHNPPSDEDDRHRPGPIYGNFWISSGSTIETINFRACHCPSGPFFQWTRDCEGMVLPAGRYSIPRGIFRGIRTAIAACFGEGCAAIHFHAPLSSAISIPYRDGSDLTIGGQIMDCDRSNSDDVLFEEQEAITINVDELEYLGEILWRTLYGSYVNMDYFVRLGR